MGKIYLGDNLINPPTQINTLQDGSLPYGRTVFTDGNGGVRERVLIDDAWPFVSETVIEPSAGNSDRPMEFGALVAIGPSRIVVSAPGYQIAGQSDNGAVFIYDHDYNLVNFIEGADNQRFGNAIAVDGNNIVISSFGVTGSDNKAGLYDLDGNLITEVFSLQPHEFYGTDVAVGSGRFVVNAPRRDYPEDSTSFNDGGIYTYDLSGNLIFDYSPTSGQYFGTSVAIGGGKIWAMHTTTFEVFRLDLDGNVEVEDIGAFAGSAPTDGNFRFSEGVLSAVGRVWYYTYDLDNYFLDSETLVSMYHRGLSLGVNSNSSNPNLVYASKLNLSDQAIVLASAPHSIGQVAGSNKIKSENNGSTWPIDAGYGKFAFGNPEFNSLNGAISIFDIVEYER